MVLNEHILNIINSYETNKYCSEYVKELMLNYNSEKNLNQLLPKMILNAKSPEIANVFTKHLKFTRKHLVAMEALFINIEKPLKT